MFSKHRKLWQAGFCLLFSLLLTLGFSLWSQAGHFPFFDETASTTMETAAAPGTTAGASRETGAEETPTEVTVESPYASAGVRFFLTRAAALGSILLALVCLGFALSLWNQTRPFLGPESEMLILLFLVLCLIRLTYVLSLDGSWAAAALFFLGLLPLSAVLGCLLAWAKARFPLSWLGTHRLALLLGGKDTPFRFYPGLILLALLLFLSAGVFFCLFAGPVFGIPFFLLSAGELSLLLWYQKGVSTLLTQIRHLQSGQSVVPSPGALYDQQEALCSLQQQTEEAVRKAVADERFKVELISNVSHDLRTPLTAILGYGELLEGESLSPEGRQRLDGLNRKSRYMRDLVDSLFELTKVSSGTVEAKRESLDLIRLLEQTVGLETDAMNASGLELRRKYCVGALPLITDGSRVHQVFMNLLENAMKYALPGTRIYLTVSETAESAVVSLTNTASYEMDFTPEEIVQRFARGDKARTTRGSGLGLAIAQTYSESVGGSFRVEVDGDQFRAIVTLPKP